ncbi:S-M checkpoint control protein rad4, partial [Bienertia sinuspersici]
YLSHLKSYVGNKAQPERSIVEGYHLEETNNFCSRYLEELETLFMRLKRSDILDRSGYLFDSGGRVIGMEKDVRFDPKSLEQGHRYSSLFSLSPYVRSDVKIGLHE